MTIIEMLDALEGEIVQLRAECARLVSALQDAQQRLRTIREAVRPTPERRKPGKKSPRDRSVLKKDHSQPALSITETGGTTRTRDNRHTGKRQALGKGLT